MHQTNADPSDIVISIITTEVKYFTNADVQYWLKVTLDDYVLLYPDEATHWEAFNVNIQNCLLNDLTFSDPTTSY